MTEPGPGRVDARTSTEPGPPPDGGGLHRNVWAASLTSFLTDVSSEMVLNVLPLFLANVLGVRVWAVGAVEGLAETTASILKLYSGWLSDRIGARKWLAVGGYCISAAAKPLYLVASAWGHVAAIRWADRVGKGVRTGPRDALLADSTTAGRRGLAFGLHRAADTAGAVVGLGVAIWVVQRLLGDAALLDAPTFRALVLASLVPAFLGVAVLAVGARDVAPERVPRRPRLRIRGLGRGFGAFVVCSALFELGNSADAFLVLRAQERGLSLTGILWVLLAFNVVYAAVAGPAGALADRVSRRGVVAASWVLYAVAYCGFALARDATDVVLLYLLYGAYHGLGAGAAKALVGDLVPDELRGTAYGGYAAVVGVVALPASLLGGVLWEGVGPWSGLGPSAPFFFGAATAVVAAVALVATVPADGSDGRASGPPGHTPGKRDPDPIPVVAAVVHRDARYLVARRPGHKRHGGRWEFPGGKIQHGESRHDAVRRELREELALRVIEVGPVLFAARDGASPFVIDFLAVRTEGEPQPLEHDEVGWFTAAELAALELAPADRAFVEWLVSTGGGGEPSTP